MIAPLMQSRVPNEHGIPSKRFRDDTALVSGPVEVIDLTSDDEGYPAKRQKPSPAPAWAQPPRSTPERVGIQGDVRQSPFRNKPTWLATNSFQPRPSHSNEKIVDRSVKTTTVGQYPPTSNVYEVTNQGPVSSNPKYAVVLPGRQQKSEIPASTPFKLPAADAIKFHVSSDDRRSQVPLSRRVTQQSTPDSRPFATTDISPASTQIVTNLALPVRPSPPTSRDSLSNGQHHKTWFQRQARPSQSPSKPLVINIPPSQPVQERRALEEQLRENTEFVKLHPDRVEKVLGVTGFSSIFTLDDEIERMKKAAQPKKRKVDRSKVVLDLPRRGRREAGTSGPFSFVHPRDQVKAVLTDRFGEKFDPPLTFTNSLNDRRIDGKFQFIKDYLIRKGVRTTGGMPRVGCGPTCSSGRCDDGCSCMTVPQGSADDEQTRMITSYRRLPNNLVVLTDEQINEHTSRAEIIECDDGCPCSADCINRVVQRGRTVPLEIFETANCGFGVRSSHSLARGQFIELYLGEVLTEVELNRREEAAEEGQSSYVYSLDWFSTQNAYQIDGQKFGSAMRFVNHSCEPNARTVPVMNQKSTKNLYYIAFFAIKDIPAGTEITIDYVPQNALAAMDRDEDGNEDPSQHSGDRPTGQMESMIDLNENLRLSQNDDIAECFCGAPKCRRRLWGGPKHRGRRKLFAEVE